MVSIASEVQERDMGLYPISIGTSMAMESITCVGEFGQGQNVSNSLPINKINKIMINFRTIVRNAIGSYKKLDKLTTESILEMCRQDILGISKVFKEHNPSTDVTIYLCSYASLNKKFKHAGFREPTSGNPLLVRMLENALYKTILANDDIKEELIDKVFDIYPVLPMGCTVISNFPLDLIESSKKHHKIALLESHTGTTKQAMEFHTKLKYDRKKGLIPFNLVTLSVFGDGNIFAPQPLKWRRKLLEISNKRNWTPATTVDKLILDVGLEKEPVLANQLKKMRKP